MTSDVKKFMQSKEAEEARSILNSAELDDINLAAEQFVKARDYIIFRVFVYNGERTRAILGITNLAFTNAKKTQEGAVIMVCKAYSLGGIAIKLICFQNCLVRFL